MGYDEVPEHIISEFLEELRGSTRVQKQTQAANRDSPNIISVSSKTQSFRTERYATMVQEVKQPEHTQLGETIPPKGPNIIMSDTFYSPASASDDTDRKMRRKRKLIFESSPRKALEPTSTTTISQQPPKREFVLQEQKHQLEDSSFEKLNESSSSEKSDDSLNDDEKENRAIIFDKPRNSHLLSDSTTSNDRNIPRINFSRKSPPRLEPKMLKRPQSAQVPHKTGGAQTTRSSISNQKSPNSNSAPNSPTSATQSTRNSPRPMTPRSIRLAPVTYRKKIHDPVSRFQEMQRTWRKDRFLVDSEKQHKSLRMQVRKEMLAISGMNVYSKWKENLRFTRPFRTLLWCSTCVWTLSLKLHDRRTCPKGKKRKCGNQLHCFAW